MLFFWIVQIRCFLSGERVGHGHLSVHPDTTIHPETLPIDGEHAPAGIAVGLKHQDVMAGFLEQVSSCQPGDDSPTISDIVSPLQTRIIYLITRGITAF